MTENNIVAGLPEEDLQIISAKLPEAAEDLDHYKNLLSPEEKERERSLCISERRNSYSLAHGILHIILGRFLNKKPEAIIIRYDRKGIPFAAEHKKDVRFSLSYSGDYALYSIARALVSGIDVQQWKELSDPLRFARRYFTAGEHELLINTEKTERLSLFYRIWARKEACTKAMGMGRAIPFDSFEVSPGLPSPKISIRLPDGKSYHLSAADPRTEKGYSASAAVLTTGTAPRFTRINFDPLFFS